MTTKVPFQARGSMVLVRRIEKADEKVGMIVIPVRNGEQTMEAEVLSVGPGTQMVDTSDLRAGQRVLIQVRSGSGIQATNKSMVVPARELGIPVLFGNDTFYLHNAMEVVGILAE